MKHSRSSILTINGGSSSIKFAVYQSRETLPLLLQGKIETVGPGLMQFSFADLVSGREDTVPIEAADHGTAAAFLIDWMSKHTDPYAVSAIGHRIVYGMKHTKPERITSVLLAELKRMGPYDPEHLPGAIQLIELFARQYPDVPQVACFDTSFHTSMPPVAKLLPIPRRYQAMGIQRYGFHGLSYAYLLEELERMAGSPVAKGKIILAHLGNGASLAAVKAGKSVDTSMGFTPASGLPMSTRTGDLDPGVAAYLMETEKLTPQAFEQLTNHRSGMLGISGTSGDMRELLKLEATDSDAAEAVALFCYQAKKWIGSFAAVLEGLETLVFAGGIGEHAPEVRRRICSGLGFLGIEIDKANNERNDTIISSRGSKVNVYVIKTDEALMIARLTGAALGLL